MAEAYVKPTLSPDQQARKEYLLSRFRHFAKMFQGSYYHDQPHDEQADTLELCMPKIGEGQTQHKQMFLAPRYSYKTSMLLCFMVYCILYYRERGIDISIDYVRADAALAESVLYELKMALQTNETIIELWGDLHLAANLWAAKQINLGSKRDATVTTSGLNFGGAGKHPDLVLLDDMVNEKNFDSQPAKRAARTKLQAYYPILPPWGSLIVSGTRFANNDVYGWILDQVESDARKHRELMAQAAERAGEPAKKIRAEANKYKPQWDIYIRAVQDSAGAYYFPAVLNEAFLEDQKRSLEARFYAAWYLNQPYAEGMVRFRLDYLKYFSARYSNVPIPVLELVKDVGGVERAVDEFPVRVTMTIDPTVTAHATSDWTGISVVATDADGFWWVLMAARYLEVPSKIGEIAVEIIRRYHPSVILIESAMADVDMVKRIERAIILEKLPCRIDSYHPLRDEGAARGRRKKSARIEALEPRFRNGLIALHRMTCEALYAQYRDWPDVDHDDVFDALSMQYAIAKPCAYRSLKEAEWDRLESDDEEDPGAIFAAYRSGASDPVLMGRAGKGSQRLYTG